MNAVHFNHADVLKLLIESGANINHQVRCDSRSLSVSCSASSILPALLYNHVAAIFVRQSLTPESSQSCSCMIAVFAEINMQHCFVDRCREGTRGVCS